ncbi:hypothetical protein WDW86_21030 [Bdellovibrionota bacterium FG-2]
MSILNIQKIALAMAIYEPKAEHFLEQLQSIKDQTFQAWQCFITSDSPIATFRSNPDFATFFEDARVVWSENPQRLGHKKNFERAIQLASGSGAQAVGCADQDDLWYPEKLAVSKGALEKAGPLSLVHCDMDVLRNGGQPKGQKDAQTAWKTERRGIHDCAPQHFLIRNIVAGCSMLFDAELARRFASIPEEAEYHDHWYALVASCYGGVHAIAEPLFAYRVHGENVVGVSPYHSLFYVPQGVDARGVIQKCKTGWKKSQSLALAAQSAGLPMNDCQRGIFLKQDLGLGILMMGLRHLGDDLPLARACLARGAGKFFLTFGL